MSRILLLFVAIVQSLVAFSQNSLTDFVNPLIGTKGIFIYGRTNPFVTPPFGMTHWTPVTRNSRIRVPLYKYMDNKIIGFRGSHKPAMWMGDYGYVSIMPGIGKVKGTSGKRKLLFSHKNEASKSCSYSVKLKKNIRVKMSATKRCGIFNIIFPPNKAPHIIIEASQNPDFGGWIKIDPEKREITGWNADRNSAVTGPTVPGFKGYFVIRFDQPFESYGTWNGNKIQEMKGEEQSKYGGGYVTFKKGTGSVKAVIATSFISEGQAQINLENEIPIWDLRQVEDETRLKWENYLNRIEIEGATEDQKAIFYTAMYHSLLFPRQFSEYGLYYSAFDDKVHNGISYNDFSLWDTFRALHPLLLFIAPEHVPGMINALLQMYEEGGYLPKWPNPTYTNIMIGTHADAVIADAVVKGVHGFDLQKAYAAVWKDAMVPPEGDSTKTWADRAPWTSYEARGGSSWYNKIGYVPADKTTESVSRTLEFAYDDFCVAQVAKAAGKMDDYEMFMKRSKNYRNVYNPETGFMAPKNLDGSWHRNAGVGFTEGSPWTYLFCAMQDIPGLIELMGEEEFIKKLDKNYNGGHYRHSNEPGHHYCYLYDYAGEPWKTQEMVAEYRAKHYRNSPGGMDGDDDCGQMSAWYIFSALGFYPVTPGSDVYAIGTPLFPKATIYFNPENRNDKFEIIAKNVSAKNIYVQSATLNGVKLKTPFMKHQDIVSGGQLVFEMGPEPNYSAF